MYLLYINSSTYVNTLCPCYHYPFIFSSQGGRPSTPWDNNFWLDLDFLDVARAAQRCSAYFTSLLYIEIWRGGAAAGRNFPCGGHTPVDESLDLDDVDEV